MSKKNHDQFLSSYSNWLNSAMNIVLEKSLFENVVFYKIFGVIYSLLGLVIGLILINSNTYFSSIIVVVMSVSSLLLFILFYKRTIKGMEDYQKWISFKQFLNNFNAELPDINVFKLYLIYSLNLGGFDKFIKNINNKYMNDKKIKNIKKLLI